jgi:hypothetical protein
MTTTEQPTTTYAFTRPVDRRIEIIWTSTDPAEVAKRWAEPDVRERPLRVLRDGRIMHASVAEAQAVYAAR